MEAEKEELSEEIAALQQERDEGLLLAESEKQQVCEPGGSGALQSPPSTPHPVARSAGSSQFLPEPQLSPSGPESWRPSTVQ